MGSQYVDFFDQSFEPERDGVMNSTNLFPIPSTPQQVPKLPQLRPSAEKYNPNRRREPVARCQPSPVINTSVLARAFPDFTSGESTLSIEMGRGRQNINNNVAVDPEPQHNHSSNTWDDDSLDHQAPMIGNYQVMYTPPLRSKVSSRKEKQHANTSIPPSARASQGSPLQKELNEPSPPLAKATNRNSVGSRQSSGDSRHTLAAMHARVTTENDDTKLSDERPPTVSLTARNTRFASAANFDAIDNSNLPRKYSSTNGIVEAPSRGITAQLHSKSHRAIDVTVSSSNNPGTQQSLTGSELPNMSELVSGTFHDGTPIFSRDGKSRASRFVSAQLIQVDRGLGHPGVDEVDLTDEEKAIFLSLRLLQDKVEFLEHVRADREATIGELQNRNQNLQQETVSSRRWQRNDSALGSTDGGSDNGDEFGRGSRKLLIEKARLESAVHSLREQSEALNHEKSVAKITIRNLTQERDAVVSQLAKAYITTEHLKGDNEILRDENEQLKMQIAQLTGGEAVHANVEEANEEANGLYGEQMQKEEPIEDEESNHTADIEQECVVVSNIDPNDSLFEFSEPALPKLLKEQPLNPMKATVPMFSGPRSRKNNMLPARKQAVLAREPAGNEEVDHSSHKIVNEGYAVEDRVTGDEQKAGSVSNDLTGLSFISAGNMAKIRKTLEEERVAQAQKTAPSIQAVRASVVKDQLAETMGPIDTAPSQQSVPKTSVLKTSLTNDLTSRVNVSKMDNAMAEETIPLHTRSVHNRRHSEDSVLTRDNQRLGLNKDDTASAFIIPDITMRDTEPVQEPTIDLSLVFDEETTPRPSQPPSVALAAIKKGIEDELVVLKERMSHYSAMYNKHDPTMSKRKRKAVFDKMNSLNLAIDAKCDHLYSIHDVLEAHRATDHEITDRYVKETLQSIGVEWEGV